MKPHNNDVAALFAAIEKINRRLDKIERTDVAFHDSRMTHPSLDKFSVAEAVANEMFAGVQKEKACTFEPSKPCDHCSMCNSLGF